MTDDEFGLTAMFHEVLTGCLDRGMPLPWLVACVAINGSMTLCRYDQDADGLEAEILTLHDGDPPGFMVPVNIMVVDAFGDAVRVVIVEDGTAWH